MKAWTHHRYGSPDVLALTEVDAPAVDDDCVLVRVKACSVNPYDWHYLRGLPLIARPMLHGLRGPRKGAIPVADIAGVVESVGAAVTRFRVGDEVYGEPGSGGFAEYVSVKEAHLVPKPAGISFEQAAGVPMAALTALQGLRDHGRLEAGQSVLVNGASGGIGSFGIQLAKALGASRVTAVCGASKADLVRSIGADAVIDYEATDFTRAAERYDVILDTVGNHGVSALFRATAPRGTIVAIGGGGGRIIGPIGYLARAVLLKPFVRRHIANFVASTRTQDLKFVNTLIESGKVTPVVGRTFPFAKAPDAIRLLEEGHATGKIVVTI
jgi:NADPH:quinone reductase-like Zn-dependent oxidoreductase